MNARLGKYEVLTRLSVGGMAELHLGCMPGPGGFRKFVALKQILPDVRQDEQFVSMFLDEARLTAALTHPNIGQVFDLGQEDGELFLAMEFIAGVNLAQVLKLLVKSGQPAPAGFACRVVRDACLALHHAHTFRDQATDQSMPIVHRDVSPKNLMVSFDGVVKVIDFGIAKTRGRLIRTEAGQVKGTVPYMSPEQLLDEPLDGRSDLYSLGVVLWELLTARRLHAGKGEQEIMVSIVNGTAPPPSSVSKVSAELDTLVTSMLARDPASRPATGRELAKALEQACPELFDEEQLSSFLTQLFPETKAALRTLLATAQKEELDTGALTKDVKRLRLADEKSGTANVGVNEALALPSQNAPVVFAKARASRTLMPFALAGCGVLVLAVVGWLVLLGEGAAVLFASPPPPPGLDLTRGKARPGDELLGDGARAREVDLALQTGDFERVLGLLSLCVAEGAECRQTKPLLDEVNTLQLTRCGRGGSAFEVLEATWAQLRGKHWQAARRSLDACKYEKAVGFRVQALEATISVESQLADALDRAVAIVERADATVAELEKAQALVYSARGSTLSAARLAPLEADIQRLRANALKREERGPNP